MKITPFPLTSASFPVSALAGMLAISACDKNVGASEKMARAIPVASSSYSVDGAALIRGATHHAMMTKHQLDLHVERDLDDEG